MDLSLATRLAEDLMVPALQPSGLAPVDSAEPRPFPVSSGAPLNPTPIATRLPGSWCLGRSPAATATSAGHPPVTTAAMVGKSLGGARECSPLGPYREYLRLHRDCSLQVRRLSVSFTFGHSTRAERGDRSTLSRESGPAICRCQ